MQSTITKETILGRLDENEMHYAVLDLQNGASLIITQHGGRVLGPFQSARSESILWVSDLFGDATAFKESIGSGQWNLGGERIWISPEIAFNVKERSNFWESYHIPAAIDPGHYKIGRGQANNVRLSQDMTLTGYGSYSGVKELRLEREILRADDPLRNLRNYDELLNGIEYVGFEHVVTLSERAASRIDCEVWDLLQVKSGGTLYVATLPHAEHTEYYQPTEAEYKKTYKNHIRFRITGDRKYKVGFKSASLTGRVAYMNTLRDGRTSLIIRSFTNNPSAHYVEGPFAMPDCHGHSLHVYNDDGSLGSFGELECNGQTIGQRTGKRSSTDTMSLWTYVGDANRLARILYQLLGIQH